MAVPQPWKALLAAAMGQGAALPGANAHPWGCLWLGAGGCPRSGVVAPYSAGAIAGGGAGAGGGVADSAEKDPALGAPALPETAGFWR
jgi:hypothetical protein